MFTSAPSPARRGGGAEPQRHVCGLCPGQPVSSGVYRDRGGCGQRQRGVRADYQQRAFRLHELYGRELNSDEENRSPKLKQTSGNGKKNAKNVKKAIDKMARS